MSEAQAQGLIEAAQRSYQALDAQRCLQRLNEALDVCRAAPRGQTWPAYRVALDRLLLVRALLLGHTGPGLAALVSEFRRLLPLFSREELRRGRLRLVAVHAMQEDFQSFHRQWHALLHRPRKGSDLLDVDVDLVSRLCRDLAAVGFHDEAMRLLDFGTRIGGKESGPAEMVNLLETFAAQVLPPAMAMRETGSGSRLGLQPPPGCGPPASHVLEVARDAILTAQGLRSRCPPTTAFFHPGSYVTDNCLAALRELDVPGTGPASTSAAVKEEHAGFPTWQAVTVVMHAPKALGDSDAEGTLRRIQRARPYLQGALATAALLQQARALAALRRLEEALHAHRDYAQSCFALWHRMDAFRVPLGKLVNAIVGRRHRVLSVPAQAAATVAPGLCARAMAVMQLNVKRTLRIDELANQLGCARRALENVFRSEAGMGPAEYFLQLRLGAVKAQITAQGGTAPSLKRLAYEHGFTNYAAFSRAYTRRFGVSPSCAMDGPDPASSAARGRRAEKRGPVRPPNRH